MLSRCLTILCLLLLAAPAAVTAAPGGTATFVQLREPVWSPSGKQLAFVRWQQRGYDRPYADAATVGQVWVANADGSNAHAVTKQLPVPRSLSWAPDSRSIVFTSAGAMQRLDVRSKTLVSLGTGGTNSSWSPDGAKIAYLTLGTHGGEIDAIPARGGAATYLGFYGGTPGVSGLPLTWSPDSRYVVAEGYLHASDGSGGQIETDAVGWSRSGARKLTRDHTVVDMASGRTFPVPALIRPQLSPDGTAVGGTTLNGKVRIATVATTRIATAPGAQSANDTVSWSPQRRLAYVGSGRCGARSQIDAVNVDSTAFRVVARSC